MPPNPDPTTINLVPTDGQMVPIETPSPFVKPSAKIADIAEAGAVAVVTNLSFFTEHFEAVITFAITIGGVTLSCSCYCVYSSAKRKCVQNRMSARPAASKPIVKSSDPNESGMPLLQTGLNFVQFFIYIYVHFFKQKCCSFNFNLYSRHR